jgi:N-glycosidase YbiA
VSQANLHLLWLSRANQVSDQRLDFYGGQFSSFAALAFGDADHTYPTREHYFQSQKTLEASERRLIVAAAGPAQAKALGRRVHLRADWEEIKYQVMVSGIRAQAEQNPGFRHLLLLTGQRQIREDSPTDGIWGCRPISFGPAAGPGLNLLGKALMEVRDSLR